ncbi:MAG: hypothetical protein QNJ72_23905 [Pleurocapsa sp. MO_226.B13]|nr:hypothetical protein [Pleurocapsa sp. MO_226.B13]
MVRKNKIKESEKNSINGSNLEEMDIEDKEAIIKEFFKEIEQNTGATLVLNGNGNGSKNLILNSIVLQTTDKETSDLIVDKIKSLPSETFEEILLAIAEQLRERNKNYGDR